MSQDQKIPSLIVNWQHLTILWIHCAEKVSIIRQMPHEKAWLMDNIDISLLNVNFQTRSPEDILAWSWKTFRPDIVASSSFQTQSVALLHMIAQICPQMTILFVDTGYHFPETLAFRDKLTTELDLNIQTVFAAPQNNEYLPSVSEPLYLKDPDLCCRINKIAPVTQALIGKSAWISGVRRDQTEHRKQMNILERRPDGLIKIHPLLNWNSKDLWKYIHKYNLPSHPLFSQGYMSIGCAPCTRPITAGENERSGRWTNSNKTECGLHTSAILVDNEKKE